MGRREEDNGLHCKLCQVLLWRNNYVFYEWRGCGWRQKQQRKIWGPLVHS